MSYSETEYLYSLHNWDALVLNLYEVQKEELINLAESNNSIPTNDEIYSKIDSHRIHQKVVAIGNLVFTCNNICKAKSKAPIFKITERLGESILNLTLLIAEDNNSFSMIINLLFQILYEGSGTNKPLYLSGMNPLISESESEFMDCLRILRNKWLMHNTDRKGKDAVGSD